ncbi:MAG: TerB family tellurite resistance protein [Burkholderiales bacterium]|nr:TerB family tellurite resistance protein [Burkholderiales bacterium]
MRSYPIDSPQAAARILALTATADGLVDPAELDWLDRHGVHQALGLSRSSLLALLAAHIRELREVGHWVDPDICPFDERTLADLMAEIQDPTLRRRLLGLCVALAQADEFVAEAESAVLVAAVEHWGLQHAMVLPDAPALANH